MYEYAGAFLPLKWANSAAAHTGGGVWASAASAAWWLNPLSTPAYWVTGSGTLLSVFDRQDNSAVDGVCSGATQVRRYSCYRMFKTEMITTHFISKTKYSKISKKHRKIKRIY